MKGRDSDYCDDMGGLFPEILAMPETEESLPGFQFQEETVEEFMQELWKEISSPPARLPSPYVSPEFAVSTCRESCGASFSDSASTVMVGVEMAGGLGGASLVGFASRISGWSAEGKGPAMEVAEAESYVPELVAVSGKRMDGCDGVEFDDEWLSRVLSWGPPDLDDWT